MTNEQWRPIVGHEGRYEVSNRGQVRSLDRWVTYRGAAGIRRLHRGKVLNQSKLMGYPAVPLSTGSKSRNTVVHKLVLEAFVGPRPEGLCACHNDGDQTNNTVENLRWDTQANNVRDSLKHGTQAMARKTHCPQNHPYDEENTYRSSRGHRSCRVCSRERDRIRNPIRRPKKGRPVHVPRYCEQPGCDKPYLARGLCGMHYARTKRAA